MSLCKILVRSFLIFRSMYKLSAREIRLPAKGLNFSLPPKYLDYVDYLVNFELFCRNIRNLSILSNEDLDFIKARTKEPALSLSKL